MSCIILEDLVRRHLADSQCLSGIHEVNDIASPDEVHQRNDDEPYKETSAADDECVLESDNITQTKDRCTGVDFKYDLCLLCDGSSPWKYLGSQCLAPKSECGNYEIIETSDDAAYEQGLGSLAAAFSAYEYLCGCGCFRERILSVLFLHEVLSERNQEQDAEDTSQKRREEYLGEVYCQFRIFVLKYEQGGECEYRAGYDGS